MTPPHPAIAAVLIAFETFQVVFLWIHDLVPLPPLNDVAAVRAQDSRARLALVTCIQSLPFTFGLAASATYWGRTYPGWLQDWLLVSYALLFAGQLRAWWVPYLLIPEPARAARYRAMFGRTAAFLPIRNGMVPNTAHILLHAATLLTLVVLLAAH